MARDRDRLRRVASHLSSAQSWAEQYPDEATALAAMAAGAATAEFAAGRESSAAAAVRRIGSSSLIRVHAGQWKNGVGAPSLVMEPRPDRLPLNYTEERRGPAMGTPSVPNEMIHPTVAANERPDGAAPPPGGGGPHRPSAGHPANQARAARLRERVTRAQRALDERALKLKQALARERDKLKQFQAGLEQRERDLGASLDRRREALEREFAARRAKLDAEQDAIARRKAEIEGRQKAMEEANRALTAQQQRELEEAADARIEEIETGVRNLSEQLEEKSREISQQERRLSQALHDRRAELEREISVRRAELEGRQQSLALRESEIEKLLAKRMADVRRQEAELAGRQEQLDRDAEALRDEAEDHEREWSHRAEDGRLDGSERDSGVATAAAGSDEFVERQRIALLQREAELDEREAALACREEQIERGSAGRHDGDVNGIGDGRAESDARLQEIERREAELRDEREQFEARCDDRAGELREHADALQEQARLERDRLAEESRELQSRATEATEARERELSELRSAIEEREKEVARREGELTALKSSVERDVAEARQQRMALDARSAEIETRSARLEDEEQRYWDWSAEARQTQAELDEARRQLEQQQQLTDEARDSARQLAVRLDERARDLKQKQETLGRERESLDARSAELGERFLSLDGREARLEALQKELDRGVDRMNEDRAKLADVDERAREYEARHRDLTARFSELEKEQQAVRAMRAVLESDRAGCRGEREQLDEWNRRLNERESALGQQEAELAKRLDEAGRQQERIGEQAAAQERMRATLDKQMEDLNDREDALEQRRVAVDSERARINEDRQAVSAERESVSRQDAELKSARDELATKQEALDVEIEDGRRVRAELDALAASLQQREAAITYHRENVDAERETIQRQKDELRAQSEALASDREKVSSQTDEVARRGEALDAASANLVLQAQEHAEGQRQLEEDRAALREQQQRLAELEQAAGEEKARAETLRVESEDIHLELSRRITEIEEIRQALVEKAERHRARKARLAVDAVKVDSRLKELNAELEAARGDREQMNADRLRLEDERREFEEARRRFQDQEAHSAAAAAAVEEKTAEGARQLEEREVGLWQREADAADLERRLEDERKELRASRETLEARHRESDASSQRLADMMEEARVTAEGLRRRQEALDHRERDLDQRDQRHAEAETNLDEEAEALRRRGVELENERTAAELREQEVRATLERQRAELQAAKARLDQEIEAGRRDLENERADLTQRIREELGAEVRREGETRREELDEAKREFEVDVDARLTQLEKREAEFEQRRAAAEAAAGDRRARLDADIDDLRRRRAALEEEMDIVRRERAESDSGATVVERSTESIGVREAASTPGRDVEGAVAGADLSAVAGENESRREIAIDADEVDAIAWEADSPETDDVQSSGRAVDADDSPEVPLPSAIGATMPARPSAARRIGVPVMGLLSGAAAFLAYVWIPNPQVEVRGRLEFPADAGLDGAAARQQIADLTSANNPTLADASTICGEDLAGLCRGGTIQLRPAASGRAVILAATVPADRQRDAEQWLGAIGESINNRTDEAEPADGEAIQERIAQLREERDAAQAELKDRRDRLVQLEDRLQLATRAQADPEAIRHRKEALRREVAAAWTEVAEAKRALAGFGATPVSTEPPIPGEAALARSYVRDVELSRAMQDRAAKAAAMHGLLATVMSGSMDGLDQMLQRIDDMVVEVREQLKQQSHPEIRRELELLASDLSEYAALAGTFATDWRRLAGRVEGWRAGDGSEMVIEFQHEAEKLVRGFHGEGRLPFSAAAEKADAIGREGAEMTKRRVLQSTLTRLAHRCLDGGNDWILAARLVVPRYNKPLKAVRDSIIDLSPRIEEWKAEHRSELIKELTLARQNEHRRQLAELRSGVEAAERRHVDVTKQFLNADEAAQLTETIGDDMTELRRQADEEKAAIARLRAMVDTTNVRINRALETGVIPEPSPAVYRAEPAIRTPMLDLRKRNSAAVIGLAVAALFIVVGWSAFPARRRPSRASETGEN